MAEPLEIRVLGPFEVLADGAPADVGGSKRQALLAMLALRDGRPVEIDALVDGLWGEELPAAPRNALHHHVARLRAALGEGAIAGFPDGYAVRDARVDAVELERLLAETRAALRDGELRDAADSVSAALALWRGPALQGLPATAWFRAEARRLESLRVDALEEQFEIALALGEHRELIPALRTALADNAFRERLWSQLMLALYRGGRQADALETFQEARSVLADELGLEPGPELRRLQEAILAHDPAIAAVPVRRRGNLPAVATSFVGRDDEIRGVVALLHEHRLVTLTGPPGVGKSRLAAEAARSLQDEFPDGVWLVDFARAGSEADGVRLLANVVGVRGSDSLARVTARLRDGIALLVLDACEHVLDGAAAIVTTILADCAGVRILATSRTSLHAPGEVRVPVAPLGPAAVDLFVERARSARPGFQLGAEEAALAAEIVRRADGLPLAIELAAARVGVLGLAEIVSILERRSALLRDSPASDPARAALQELVDWSYDLLHGDEKTLLQLLAVHRGGASLASLAALAAPRGLNEATVAYLVTALVDKSIVAASFQRGDARYDLLDSVREYVLERLDERGELESVRAAHADYFAALAEQGWVGLRGAEWLRWQHRLGAENENLWTALGYAKDNADAAVASRLGLLGWYFALSERVSEGRRFLELVVSVAGDAPPVETLSLLCYLATEELDLEAALAVGEQAAALATPKELGLPQLSLALALAQSGREESADAAARAAYAAFVSAGDDWGAAAAATIRASGAAFAGDVATVAETAGAIREHADAIEYDAFRAPGFLLEAWVAKQRGDRAAEADWLRRALDLARRIGFADHAAFALAALGSSELENGNLRDAEELEQQAAAAADACDSAWVAAHARVQLGRIAAATGDIDQAGRLYRDVLDWSRVPRPRQARESLFVALAGDPAADAERALRELNEARGAVT